MEQIPETKFNSHKRTEDPKNALRFENEGFCNERERYLKSIREFAELPKELENLRHKIDWPVDMTDLHSHIACHFGDKQNYSEPRPSHSPHDGIDVQLKAESRVIAPEDNLIVVMVDVGRPNFERGLADIILYSEESGIVYNFCHLDAKSLSEKLLERTYFDAYSKIRLNKGDEVGIVGKFFNEYTAEQRGKAGLGAVAELDPAISVPPDVEKVFGRSYNHVHISTCYHPRSRVFWRVSDLENYLNPLSLFKRLYQ